MKELHCWHNCKSQAQLLIMGNSNSPPSDLPDVFIHSQLYGRHTPSQTSIIKHYKLSKEDNQQFQMLLSRYRKMSSPRLIEVKNVKLIKEEEKNVEYEVEYQKAEGTLAEEIYTRKLQPFQEAQIAILVTDLADAYELLMKESLPCGVVTPQKIAKSESGYAIAVDILMNEDIYRERKLTSIESIRKYLAPEQLLSSSHPASSSASALAYSIGLIALTMASGEQLVTKAQISQSLFHIRSKFTYQFCQLLASMLNSISWQRPSLDVIKTDARKSTKGKRFASQQPSENGLNGNESNRQSINTENSIRFKRGYDCLESLFLLDSYIPVRHRKININPLPNLQSVADQQI